MVVDLRLVVVDDNSFVLGALTGVLSRDGIEVVGVATNSADAITVVRSAHPDLVLVDVGLGVDDGFELAARLAAPDGGPPVVLMSSRSESDLRELVDGSPAIGFLTKSQLSAAALVDCYRRSR